MLRISSAKLPGGRVRFQLEGKVIGAWVGELRSACDQVLQGGGRLTLDLANVSYFDREGLILCRQLSERQVILENPSGFVTEQLKGARCDGCLGVQA